MNETQTLLYIGVIEIMVLYLIILYNNHVTLQERHYMKVKNRAGYSPEDDMNLQLGKLQEVKNNGD